MLTKGTQIGGQYVRDILMGQLSQGHECGRVIVVMIQRRRDDPHDWENGRLEGGFVVME